MSEMEYIVN